MSRKVITDNTLVAIGAAETNTTITFKPENGHIIGVFLTDGKYMSGKSVFGELKNSRGDVLVKSMPLEVFYQRDAPFHDSYFPVDFTADGEQLKLFISMDDALGEAYQGTFMLVYSDVNC